MVGAAPSTTVREPRGLDLSSCPAATRTLTGALRAPSAHNAQPWRLAWLPATAARGPATPSPPRPTRYYDHTDYLPYDPDDRDAYLCMGALAETLGWRPAGTA